MAIRTTQRPDGHTFLCKVWLFRCLYLVYVWVYLHQTWWFCKAWPALYDYRPQALGSLSIAKERAGNEVDSNSVLFVPFFERLGLSHSFFFVSLDVHHSTRYILLKRLQTEPKNTNEMQNHETIPALSHVRDNWIYKRKLSFHLPSLKCKKM